MNVIISVKWSMWNYVSLVHPAVRKCPQQIVHALQTVLGQKMSNSYSYLILKF